MGGGEWSSETLQVKGGDLVTMPASRFWTRWSLVESVSTIPYKSELQ